MCGQAIEVPDSKLKDTRRVSSGKSVAVAYSENAASILTPGAAISGYTSKVERFE